MICVTSQAALTPTTKTQSVHDCHVGRGSVRCHTSKAYAAITETVNCSQCMPDFSRGMA